MSNVIDSLRCFIASGTKATKNTSAARNPAQIVPRQVSGLRLSLSVVLAMTTASCASTRVIDSDAQIHYDASYDFADKQLIVNHLSENLLKFVDASSARPVVISYGIGNETSEHINTAAISDDIRFAMVQSGKFQLINEAQRANIQTEAEFQTMGTVPEGQRIQQGRQLGADYILGGTLRSIVKSQPRQIRLTKKKLVHYSLNLELTHTETGSIAWADKIEIVRESSRPIIGW